MQIYPHMQNWALSSTSLVAVFCPERNCVLPFFSKHSVYTVAGKVGLPGLTERGPVLVCASAGCLLSLCSLVLALLSFQQVPFSLPIVFVSTTASVHVCVCAHTHVFECTCKLPLSGGEVDAVSHFTFVFQVA
jgi:hypothetical protein